MGQNSGHLDCEQADVRLRAELVVEHWVFELGVEDVSEFLLVVTREINSLASHLLASELLSLLLTLLHFLEEGDLFDEGVSQLSHLLHLVGV